MKAPWLSKEKWHKKPNEFNYNDPRWRKLRKQFIMANPFCYICNAQGVLTDCTRYRAGVVDHKKEITDGGDPWDWDNLQTLCTQHHNEKSAKYKQRLNKPK